MACGFSAPSMQWMMQQMMRNIQERQQMQEMREMREMRRIREEGKERQTESDHNLHLLQAVFENCQELSVTQDGWCLQVTFNKTSRATQGLLEPILSTKFPQGINRLYLSIVRPIDATDCLETLLFAESGSNKDGIYVDEWGYYDVRRFGNIDQVIEEVRRVMELIC
jgi:hypothetical protein